MTPTAALVSFEAVERTEDAPEELALMPRCARVAFGFGSPSSDSAPLLVEASTSLWTSGYPARLDSAGDPFVSHLVCFCSDLTDG